jgi:RNA polymerase sigma factor (sigma-70 family)
LTYSRFRKIPQAARQTTGHWIWLEIADHPLNRSAPMTKGVALMNPSEQIGSISTVDNGRDRRGDVLLLLAACSGDSQAFTELCKPHSKRLLLTLYRITKNWQDAEDALQEALMKAFLHLDSFQGKASFSTWFTSIAVNSALMLLRKRRGVVEIAIDNVGEDGTCRGWDIKDSRDTPEECFERQYRTDLLQSGILQLPPKLRKVVELQHSRDLSNKEIARCLGLSLAATKSRLSRARTALRVFIQHETGKSPIYQCFSNATQTQELQPWLNRTQLWPGKSSQPHVKRNDSPERRGLSSS